MTTQGLKLSIHELVNQTDDEDVLQGIYLVLKKFIAVYSERFTEFEVDGAPVSDAELIESILDADADIEAGNMLTHEEIKAKFGYGKPF